MNKKMIELSKQEITEIELQASNEGAFKQRVLGFVKQCEKVGFPLNYGSVKTQQKFQWFFISSLYLALLGIFVWVVRLK